MPLLPPGSSIGDYALVRHAATGAMSEVYEARDSRTGSRVAVKLLSPELCSEPELVARFLNEGRALQQVTHEHLVKVFTCGMLPEGPPYMVLEWVPWALHQELARVGAIPAPAVLRLIEQLADALAGLHARGLIHRDLKPSNVLLAGEDGTHWQVKLADLGLAKALPHTAEASPEARPLLVAPVSTGGGTWLGTYDYMAPEQWIGSKGVDAKADVYALGILMFQMLTGELPFAAERQKDLMYFHLFEQPPLERLEGLAPEGVRELITRMLAKKSFQRPTMREVLQSTTSALQ
ncbi:serine/threonine-protein kinase [Cystobacter fuscus]|uniref:serine/threonine-protein kinase n=1 Tax=Cystobacter fuscus TaxID=43 RepID=UPI002B30DC16|nr:serine/threonine protein kinase [Cystobacter fuscus]